MPLFRSPNAGESEQDFIHSCVSSESMKKEFPDQKQRLAVCYSKYKNDKVVKGFLRKVLKSLSKLKG